MSQWGSRSWSDWDKWSPQRSWSAEVSLPSSWKTTEIHYNETVLHGYPLYRYIQPSAWSRKRGIHGQDPLHLPVYQLLRYGVEEFSLRTLSAGRFVSLVPTRSVAESVFVSQLLRTIREANLDIGSIAEHLRRTKAPTAPVPSKQEAPVDFISPVVVSVVDLLKQIQPVLVRQDSLALKRVQSLQAQLKEAQAKLAEAEAEILASVPPASPARSAGHKRDSTALGRTTRQSQSYAASSLGPTKIGNSFFITGKNQFGFASQCRWGPDFTVFGSKISDNCKGIVASVRSNFEAVSTQRYFRPDAEEVASTISRRNATRSHQVRQNASRCSGAQG